MQAKGNAVGAVAPVGLVKLYTMPVDTSLAEILFQGNRAAFDSMIEVETEPNHPLHEPEHVSVDGTKIPVEPTGLVILTICIVVSLLRASNFISHEQHRGPNREQSEQEEVLDLLHAQTLDVLVSRRALDATVPAQIRVGAITIQLMVCLVVFEVVGDKIVEGKAVVARNEIDALSRRPVCCMIEVGAPGDTLSKLRNLVLISLDETANVIAKSSIPLLPLISTEASNLIQAACVPGFGNELGSRKNRIGIDLPKNGRIRYRLA